MKERSNPLRCEHVTKVLENIYRKPLSLTELQTLTGISPSALYFTVIPQMQQLGLIEVTYTEGLRGSVRKIVNITEKGRKLLEALMEIKEAQ